MKTCNACGEKTNSGVSIAGTFVCRSCEPNIQAQIERQQSEGKQVSVRGIARQRYRELHDTTDYTLRDIPKATWDRAKDMANDKDITLRELILELINEG